MFYRLETCWQRILGNAIPKLFISTYKELYRGQNYARLYGAQMMLVFLIVRETKEKFLLRACISVLSRQEFFFIKGSEASSFHLHSMQGDLTQRGKSSQGHHILNTQAFRSTVLLSLMTTLAVRRTFLKPL